MQDFAAELRAAREPSYGETAMEAGNRAGNFEAYLVSQAMRQGFDLGFEAGDKLAWDRARPQIEAVRESSRLAGFDSGAWVLLQQTLLGLSEVVGELESRRAHKVMLDRTKIKLAELVQQLESVHALLVPPEQHPGQIGMDDLMQGVGPL